MRSVKLLLNDYKTSDEIIIERSQLQHAKQIAQLHKSGINKGFISTLGTNFLTRLYRSLINNPHIIMLSAISGENELVGYICGTFNTDLAYQYTLRKHFFRFALSLLTNLIRLRSLKYILETLFYTRIIKKRNPGKEIRTDLNAELLSIAIADSFRKKGIGRLLLKNMEDHFKEKAIKEYKVIVLKAYDKSIKFYLSNGFEFISEIIHHERPEIIYKKVVSYDD